MANVFVYHAQDHESRVLMALLRECDAENVFAYLPVESARSMRRMNSFLSKQGVDASHAQLPFVVLIQAVQGAVQRRVLHGDGLRQWFEGLVAAVVDDPLTDRHRLLDVVVRPHLSTHTLSLLRFVLNVGGSGAPPPSAGPTVLVMPVAATTVCEPYAKANIQEYPDDDDNDDDNGGEAAAGPPQQPSATAEVMAVDGNGPVTVSDVPVRASERGKTVNVHSVIQESKKRQSMEHQTRKW